jgi:hypothetical protein
MRNPFRRLFRRLFPRPPVGIPLGHQVPADHAWEVRGGGSHEYAYEHAPETELPIRQEARALARAISEGERRRGR